MRMSCRRRSSSCSEKCSFTVVSCLDASSIPESFGREYLKIFLMDGRVASDRYGPQRHVAIEDALEEVRLLPGGVELRLAVGPRTRLELEPARAHAARDARH